MSRVDSYRVRREATVSLGAAASRLLCSDEILVGQASGGSHRQRFEEAAPVVVLPVVESERLLVHVGREMERLDGDIPAAVMRCGRSSRAQR